MRIQLVGLIITAMAFYWLGQKLIHPPMVIGQPIQGFVSDPNSQVSAKVAVLNQVLAEQSDDEVRVDQELSKLNQKERLDFRQKYRSLRPEALKDRGLIVYLLGRNIETQGDLDFLKEVLNERGCLSLKNCAVTDQETLSQTEIASHLAFPKLMAIAALKGKLAGQNSKKMREAIEVILQGARNSMNPLIVKAAS